ncbi:hypothetical protein IB289_22400 [Vibrio parahaemolyticus]|uniref:BBOF1/CCDC121 family protein n=1 Tax=Vibrio parahaemolyticus TaxID=670 RepID=UPI001D16C3FB|nr:BBOF1/CCDC121 family protein [Vibrio parahaemolyticus]MCC3859112.1 hypothetical protein [Vibrio parahaemolyticus]
MSNEKTTDESESADLEVNSHITTRDKIIKALSDMKGDSVKINPNTVAKRVGISRATLATRYPDLKLKIDEIKKLQASYKASLDDKALIEKQEKTIQSLEAKLQKIGNVTTDHDERVQVKLFETYRLYEEVSRENSDLRNRLLHSIDGDFDPETGEVLSGKFRKA